MAGGAVGAAVVSILDEAPEIDPTTIVTSLAETSSIYDPDGNLIEKIQAEELRTVVGIKEMPQHLIDAFIVSRTTDLKSIQVLTLKESLEHFLTT